MIHRPLSSGQSTWPASSRTAPQEWSSSFRRIQLQRWQNFIVIFIPPNPILQIAGHKRTIEQTWDSFRHVHGLFWSIPTTCCCGRQECAGLLQSSLRWAGTLVTSPGSSNPSLSKITHGGTPGKATIRVLVQNSTLGSSPGSWRRGTTTWWILTVNRQGNRGHVT